MITYKIGTQVQIRNSKYVGAMDYAGQVGKVVSCNQRLAYGVKFIDGQVWFYGAEDLKPAVFRNVKK